MAENLKSIMEKYGIVLTSTQMEVMTETNYEGIISQVVHSTTVFLNQVQFASVGIDFKFYGVISALIQVIGILSAQTYRFTSKFGQKNVLVFLLIFINVSIAILIFTTTLSIFSYISFQCFQW